MLDKKYKKLDGIRFEKNIYYPSTKDEIQSLIKFAQSENATIRTMGAQHSPSDAIFGKNTNQLHISLDGDLKKIHSIQPDDSKKYAIVNVGAGCYLGVNPKDKNSNLKNSFNYQVDQAGYALPTLGGISHQSIAGFLQTSSSGGSASHGIADAIEEIELINGKGEICHFKKGEDGFNAIGVGMGLFGIITNVTFKLRKKYLVEGMEENKKIEKSFLRKDKQGGHSALEKALFEDHEYAHLNWFPQKFVDRIIQWTGKAVSADLSLKPYHHPLQSKFLTYMAAVVLKTNNMLDNFASNNLFVQAIKSLLIKPFAPLNQTEFFRDEWYKALPIDDQVDVNGLIDTLFSELWFPKDQINNVMERLEKLFASDPKAISNFIVEFYAAKKSPFWMSPSYERDSFRVDLYWWSRNSGHSKEFFTRFWNVLLDVPGVRFHWGKYLPTPGEQYGNTVFDHKYLELVYPKLKEWLAIREAFDPQQLFVNDYWRNIFNIPSLLEKKVIKYSPHIFEGNVTGIQNSLSL